MSVKANFPNLPHLCNKFPDSRALHLMPCAPLFVSCSSSINSHFLFPHSDDAFTPMSGNASITLT
jgi:hypothetical protein